MKYTDESTLSAVPTNLELSPDSKFLAFSTSTRVLILNAPSFEVLQDLPAKQAFSVSFSANLAYLVYGDADGIVYLLSVPGFELIKSAKRHADHVLSVSFSPTSTRLITCSHYRVVVWALPSLEPITTQRTFAHALTCAIFLNSEIFLVSQKDGSFSSHDAIVDRVYREAKLHSGEVFALALSPDRLRCVSGGVDKKVNLFYPHSLELLRVINCCASVVRGLSFIDATMIAVGTDSAEVCVYNVNTGELARTFEKHYKPHSIQVPVASK